MTLSEFKNILCHFSGNAEYNQYAVELLINWNGTSHITVEECGEICTPDDVLGILHDMPAYAPFITSNGDFHKVEGVSLRCGADCDSVFYISINLSNTRCGESK